MTGHRFVIAEYPTPDTPLSSFTLRNPGSTIDLIMEPVVEENGRRLHQSTVLIKGADPKAIDLFLRQLGKVYDHIETIERDAAGTWLGRMRIDEKAYAHNPAATATALFQHRYGAQWCHLEAGSCHLRARVVDDSQADLLVDQMARHFQKVGVEAQVEVRDISRKDYGVWEDLVQRSIGLSP
ncbi:MAG: hypothetical protein ACYC2H_01800 [Thermoplasmatota archaeon]